MRVGEEPRLLLLDARALQAARRAVFLGDERLVAADERLLQEADQALQVGPFSVVDKETLPPGGDAHDYFSVAPYWWPDPEKEDGLPYVRRDGEVNPERRKDDSARLGAMASAVNALCLAYFYSDHEAFAERAGLLLRTWFVDEQTRMNPHLEYAQAIAGRCQGRGIGIIDAVPFVFLVDMALLLAASPAWTEEDQKGLEAWFCRYLDWLLESENGREEARQPNNHGTWYDVQVACLALFTEREEIARRVLVERAPARVATQIEPEGCQPLEVRRTRSLDYASMNLTAFFDLADLGARLGVDLWGYQTEAGSSIRAAFYWLVEKALGAREWPYPQIGPFNWAQFMPLLRRGGIRFEDPFCEERIRALAEVDWRAERTNLLYPPPGL